MLIEIKLTEAEIIKNRIDKFTISVGNARLVKNKDHMLMEYLQEINCKSCVIMEICLSEKDKIWTESSKLKPNGFDMIACNGEDRKEDGIACVFKGN